MRHRLFAAGKKPMQAIVAVMRKRLHAIWGMLKSETAWAGEKFFFLEKSAWPKGVYLDSAVRTVANKFNALNLELFQDDDVI